MTDDTDWRYSIFDSLSYPTLILCPDRIILSANRSFQERFGDKYDIIGFAAMKIIDVVTPKDAADAATTAGLAR